MFKKIALSLCFTLFLGLLNACSPDGILHLKNSESPTTSHTQNNAENTNQSADDSRIGAPVALPPTYDSGTPPPPGFAAPGKTINGLPPLSPMKGVNIDTLFAENIKDTGDRFERVEGAFIDLRKEFDSYKPAIVRLSAVEADIQNLIKELEVLLQETPAPQPLTSPEEHSEIDATLNVEQLSTEPDIPEKLIASPPTNTVQAPEPTSSSKPVPRALPPSAQTKPQPAPTPKPVAAKKYDGTVAQDLRIGEHPDKLRVVINTNKKVDYTLDLDNDEKLIILEIPDARWVGATSKRLTDSTLIESYTIESINNDKGSMIIIALKKGTSILNQSRLTPDSTSPNHRIYFDLKP